MKSKQYKDSLTAQNLVQATENTLKSKDSQLT